MGAVQISLRLSNAIHKQERVGMMRSLAERQHRVILYEKWLFNENV